MFSVFSFPGKAACFFFVLSAVVSEELVPTFPVSIMSCRKTAYFNANLLIFAGRFCTSSQSASGGPWLPVPRELVGKTEN